MPTSLKWRKAVSGTTAIAKGGPKSPESLARGMFPKGFPRNPGELAISPLIRAVTRSPRETVGDRGWMDEQSYDPIVPVKVGNRRASERSGHGTHWREGGNRRTNLSKGNIVEAQTSVAMSTQIARPTDLATMDLEQGGESRLRNPLREICTVGSARGETSVKPWWT